MEKTVGITGMTPNKPITRDMPVGEELGPRLYTAYRDGVPYAYAYGDPWVAMALYMDDIKFNTPEEAQAWWEKNYGDNKETD